jgi:hypothetical protein
MNRTLTFLTIMRLALPLVLLTPGAAVAQGKKQADPTSASGAGRQAILNKLDRIRLDTVHYESLPLSEVVFVLRDEAMKRDPEKKGINFLISQNMDPGEATASSPMQVGPDGTPLPPAPQEAVDVGAITIKIHPPLNDVRLLDVLDVVVKVADHPIKYTVEDYGVVFSPRGSEPARKDESVFSFPGGTPNEFLDSVQSQYKVDWRSVAEIPKEMADVRIPKLRLSQPYSFAAIGMGRGEVQNESLKRLVTLYNQLGEQKPELGRLIVKEGAQGDVTKPSVVMFVPGKTTADTQLKLKVKAFSIYGLRDTERAKLQEDIGLAKVQAMQYAADQRGPSGLRGLDGTVAIHNDTSLLLAMGPESFVEMVESIVTACMAKERASNPGVPMAAPPGK